MRFDWGMDPKTLASKFGSFLRDPKTIGGGYRARTGENSFTYQIEEYVIEGEHKTLFGLTYVLHPKEYFSVDTKDDNAVVPLKEIIKYCQKNIFLYRPALEYLISIFF